jgi:hypothetical protein
MIRNVGLSLHLAGLDDNLEEVHHRLVQVFMRDADDGFRICGVFQFFPPFEHQVFLLVSL